MLSVYSTVAYSEHLFRRWPQLTGHLELLAPAVSSTSACPVCPITSRKNTGRDDQPAEKWYFRVRKKVKSPCRVLLPIFIYEGGVWSDKNWELATMRLFLRSKSCCYLVWRCVLAIGKRGAAIRSEFPKVRSTFQEGWGVGKGSLWPPHLLNVITTVVILHCRVVALTLSLSPSNCLHFVAVAGALQYLRLSLAQHRRSAMIFVSPSGFCRSNEYWELRQQFCFVFGKVTVVSDKKWTCSATLPVQVWYIYVVVCKNNLKWSIIRESDTRI